MKQQRVNQRVRVVEDCRPGGSANGKCGVYEGDFPTEAVVVRNGQFEPCDYDEFVEQNSKASKPIPQLGVDIKEGVCDVYWFPVTNPRLRLDDGTTIWGYQCWWTFADDDVPMEKLEGNLRRTKDVITALIKLFE